MVNGVVLCADDVVLVEDSGPELQAMVNVVEAYVSRWKTKFNSRKSKVMVVGKREARVSWKVVGKREARVSWKVVGKKEVGVSWKVVGKREAGVSWKINEEIVEEEEEFKYLGVWVDRKLLGDVQLEKMAKKAEEWIGRVT